MEAIIDITYCHLYANENLHGYQKKGSFVSVVGLFKEQKRYFQTDIFPQQDM